MRLSHAVLLLIVLPALLVAAPAPISRQRKTEAGGWSKPVDGLRVRLVAQQTRYRLGETIRFHFEIQNVSGGRLSIEEPHLSPSICDPADAPSGWVITSEKRVEDRRLVRVQRRLEVAEWNLDRDVSLLGAGESLLIEITARTGRRGEGKAGERKKRKDEPRREVLHFRGADEAGSYELRATFTPNTAKREVIRERGWPGQSLTSPPVRIELEK